MSINNTVNFEVEKKHSNRKDTDYYAVVLVIGSVRKVLCFLTETEYNLITSKK